MVVQLFFFGATADLVGKRHIELNLDKPISASEVLRDIAADHPALHEHKLLFSINQEYAAADSILKDGDELAIFAPVSGG